MAEAEIHPAPVIEVPAPPNDKWQREKHAFYQLRPQLLSTHLGKYVAIHEGRVVDSDTDEIALALRVYRQIGYAPIFVGFVTDKPIPPVRIPSPRVVSEGLRK